MRRAISIFLCILLLMASADPACGMEAYPADSFEEAVSKNAQDAEKACPGGLAGNDAGSAVFGDLAGNDAGSTVFGSLAGNDAGSAVFGGLADDDAGSAVFGDLADDGIQSQKGASAGSSDYTRLNLQAAWKYSKGKGVNVAVIGTGFDLNDSAIRSNIKGVYDVASGTSSRSKVHSSESSHDTSCARVLVGVAPKVNLYLIKAGEGEYLYTDQVTEGLRWAKSQKCRVISMSFGGSSFNSYEHKVIEDLYRAASGSALVCASGGNSGKKEYHYAASYDNTLSVGAATYNSKKGKYAVIPKGTYNNRMDLVAPGSSTSASCPFAAGVAALMFGANKKLTAEQCRNILTGTAKDLGKKGKDSHYGYGLIQPYKAVKKAAKKAK